MSLKDHFKKQIAKRPNIKITNDLSLQNIIHDYIRQTLTQVFKKTNSECTVGELKDLTLHRANVVKVP